MNRNLQCLFLLSAVMLVTTACAPSLVITPSGGNTADISFSSGISSFGASLTRRFAGAADQTTPLYDRSAVKASLEQTGLTVHSLSFPGGDGIDFSGSVSDFTTLAGSLLSTAPAGKGMIITFSPDSVQQMVHLLPPETRDMLELLMAPVLTGEVLESSEYLDILAAAYGKSAASEMAASVCTIQIHAPSSIQNLECDGTNSTRVVTGFTGRYGSVQIPLDLLLTLTSPITLTLYW